MMRKSSDLSQKIPILVFYVLIIILPLIITSVMLHEVINSDITQYHPTWTDEVDYWIEINAFKQTDFDSGYFSINEMTAHSSFSHYGTHGPAFPILYGSIARLFGWFDYSGPEFNLVFICFSLFLFVVITKPSIKQCLYITLFLLFFYQLYLYIPTLMQESLNTGFAIIFSALFIRLFIIQDKQLSIKIGILSVILIASLFRIIWIFALFPVLIELFKNKNNVTGKYISPLIVGILLSLVVALVYWYWTSPYPGGVFYQLTNGQLGLRQMAQLEFGLIISNLKKLFGIDLPPIETEIFVRYIYLSVILIFAVRVKKQPRISLSMLFILVSSLLLTIFIYDVGNFRILAPFLLASLFASVFYPDQVSLRYISFIYIVVSLFTFFNFIENYRYFHTGHFYAEDTNSVHILQPFDQLNYSDGADPWCNSLLTTRVYSRELLDIPAGIGLNVIKDIEDTKFDIKSHFLLVPYDILAINGIVSTCETIELFSEDLLCVRTNDGCN